MAWWCSRAWDTVSLRRLSNRLKGYILSFRFSLFFWWPVHTKVREVIITSWSVSSYFEVLLIQRRHDKKVYESVSALLKLYQIRLPICHIWIMGMMCLIPCSDRIWQPSWNPEYSAQKSQGPEMLNDLPGRDGQALARTWFLRGMEQSTITSWSIGPPSILNTIFSWRNVSQVACQTVTSWFNESTFVCMGSAKVMSRFLVVSRVGKISRFHRQRCPALRAQFSVYRQGQDLGWSANAEMDACHDTITQPRKAKK